MYVSESSANQHPYTRWIKYQTLKRTRKLMNANSSIVWKVLMRTETWRRWIEEFKVCEWRPRAQEYPSNDELKAISSYRFTRCVNNESVSPCSFLSSCDTWFDRVSLYWLFVATTKGSACRNSDARWDSRGEQHPTRSFAKVTGLTGNFAYTRRYTNYAEARREDGYR